MESVLHNPNVTTAEDAGPDRGILRQTWRNVILAETQLELISRLVQLNLGLPDIEEFIQNQEGKLKSSKFQFNFKKQNAFKVKLLMKSKLADAQERYREAKKAKECKRHELYLKFGPKSRRCKNVLSKLNREMNELRANIRSKNKDKVAWLLSKYREDSKNNDGFTVPDDVIQYQNVKIFSPDFQVPETDQKPEILVIGDLQPPLDSDELAALTLHPKTAVNGTLKLEDFKLEVGQCSTKLRWEIGREEEEKVDVEVETTAAEEEMMEETEARSRLPFDPRTLTLDLRKRKVTDTRENSRIYMPKPVSIREETNIHLREEIYDMRKLSINFMRKNVIRRVASNPTYPSRNC